MCAAVRVIHECRIQDAVRGGQHLVNHFYGRYGSLAGYSTVVPSLGRSSVANAAVKLCLTTMNRKPMRPPEASQLAARLRRGGCPAQHRMRLFIRPPAALPHARHPRSRARPARQVTAQRAVNPQFPIS